MIEEARAQGPVVVLDSGNALWRPRTIADGASRERASFILRTMGKLGTRAMAPGSKDLVAGAGWLKAEAAKAKVPVLSANLVGKDGKPLFPASSVIESGGKKIGLIGVSPPQQFADAKGLPVVKAVLAEAKKLRKDADLLVVLAAIPYADALQLSREAGGQVDVILQSHEGHGTGPLQRGEGNFLARSGERGRFVGKLSVDLGGRGPLVDAGQLQRDEQSLVHLDRQIERVGARIEATRDPAGKQSLMSTLNQFTERRRQLAQQVAQGKQSSGRRVSLDWQLLGAGLDEDAALAAEVKRIEPIPPAH